jgi:hypothetical protein
MIVSHTTRPNMHLEVLAWRLRGQGRHFMGRHLGLDVICQCVCIQQNLYNATTAMDGTDVIDFYVK